jgi:hypothetical protein
MKPAIDELSRIDVDGDPAYSADDFMDGEVSVRNKNYGYWNSNNMETYPNPFFISKHSICRVEIERSLLL